MSNDFNATGKLSIRLDGLNGLAGNGLGAEPEEQRRTFRTAPYGLRASVQGGAGVFDITDISAGGLRMAAPQGKFREGERLLIDVLILGRRYLSDMPAVVLRHPSSSESACAFQNLTRPQEVKLDKLVLEMQKRYIAHRRQQREAQEALQGVPRAAGQDVSPGVRNGGDGDEPLVLDNFPADLKLP